jgi:hypothetical protein
MPLGLRSGLTTTSSWGLPMYQQCAEWKARAAECQQAAQVALDAAVNDSFEDTKVEFLLVATELLKLSDEIDKQLAGERKLVRCTTAPLIVSR